MASHEPTIQAIPLTKEEYKAALTLAFEEAFKQERLQGLEIVFQRSFVEATVAEIKKSNDEDLGLWFANYTKKHGRRVELDVMECPGGEGAILVVYAEPCDVWIKEEWVPVVLAAENVGRITGDVTDVVQQFAAAP